jgi:hypothetical protein
MGLIVGLIIWVIVTQGVFAYLDRHPPKTLAPGLIMIYALSCVSAWIALAGLVPVMNISSYETRVFLFLGLSISFLVLSFVLSWLWDIYKEKRAA